MVLSKVERNNAVAAASANELRGNPAIRKPYFVEGNL
jgi:hypothetical protein